MEKKEKRKITLRELLEYTNEDEKVYICGKDDEYIGRFRADTARKYLCESLLEGNCRIWMYTNNNSRIRKNPCNEIRNIK